MDGAEEVGRLFEVISGDFPKQGLFQGNIGSGFAGLGCNR
jgi:hypothetical protein